MSKYLLYYFFLDLKHGSLWSVNLYNTILFSVQYIQTYTF